MASTSVTSVSCSSFGQESKFSDLSIERLASLVGGSTDTSSSSGFANSLLLFFDRTASEVLTSRAGVEANSGGVEATITGIELILAGVEGTSAKVDTGLTGVDTILILDEVGLARLEAVLTGVDVILKGYEINVAADIEAISSMTEPTLLTSTRESSFAFLLLYSSGSGSSGTSSP